LGFCACDPEFIHGGNCACHLGRTLIGVGGGVLIPGNGWMPVG